MRWLPFRRRSGWRPSSLRLTVQTLRCLTFRGSIDIQFQQTHETMNLVFHFWCFVLNRSPISGRSRSPSVVSGTLTSPGYLMIAGGAMPNISGCVGINSYDNSARQAFHNLLETARDHYENKLLRVAGCLAEKVVWAIDPNTNLIRLVASELIFFFLLWWYTVLFIANFSWFLFERYIRWGVKWKKIFFTWLGRRTRYRPTRQLHLYSIV